MKARAAQQNGNGTVSSHEEDGQQNGLGDEEEGEEEEAPTLTPEQIEGGRWQFSKVYIDLFSKVKEAYDLKFATSTSFFTEKSFFPVRTLKVILVRSILIGRAKANFAQLHGKN